MGQVDAHDIAEVRARVLTMEEWDRRVRCHMTYYRVAFQASQSNTWQWESREIGSLDLLFRALSLHRTVPWDRIRVFFASSVACLEEMLAGTG